MSSATTGPSIPAIPPQSGPAMPPGGAASPALQVWSSITQTPELVGYFRGVFTTAGVRVEESGEEFTVTHHGERISFAPGLADDVEFVVPVKQENIANLVVHARDGRFDPEESWRIVQVLFTPLARAALQSPMISRGWLRMLSGVEPVIHVHLLHPNGDEAVTHTLAYAGSQWLVIPGLHGRAGRTFRMTAAQALEFQRKIYQALKRNTWGGWYQFANWYREWRVTCSAR